MYLEGMHLRMRSARMRKGGKSWVCIGEEEVTKRVGVRI
jgi:hypothetical protein